MKRFCYVIKFWWGLIFFQPTDLHAVRYFVATNGNDAANSGTINSPWRTFQRAANTALAGDTVFFRAGQYFERQIQLPNSGNAAQYITFKNFANEIVTFDGSAQRDSFLLIKNRAYIRVVGLHFRNLLGNDSFGVRIRGTSHHIELRKCSITNVYFSTNSGVPPDTSDNTHGIFITGESSTAMYAITVDSCEIKDCRTGQSEAITVVGNVRDFKITHCRINNTGNIGIVVAGFYGWCNFYQARSGVVQDNIVENCRSLKAIAAGIYVDGGKSIIIERNIVRNGQRGFQIGCENQSFLTYAKADSVVLRNNIAYGNSRGGIGLGTINHPANPAKVTNSWVLNNTCYNNYVSQIEFGTKEDFGELNLDFSEHCAVRNNIFASSIAGRDRLMNSYPSTPPVNLNIDYNFWYEATNATPYFVYANAAYVGFVHYKNSLGKDVNGRFETPSFYNVSNNNFRLGVSSLANEAGDNTPFWLTATGATDFDFKPRLKGIRTEPGAYEQHCINGQVISQNIASGPQKFESNTTITISSKISANTQVELDAGQSITIQPGFEAPKTSTFKAYIDGCGNK